MDRVTKLADLYRVSVQEYTKTPGEWKGLLSCVARFYKRSFDNAVLIYAQKPNATQLGTFAEWHDPRIGRSINRGAKSIAVIDMVKPNASIKYLFDFLDTNGSVQSCRNLQKYLWKLEEGDYHETMVHFREKYQLQADSIEACLHGLIVQRVREMLPAYLEGFRVVEEKSPLYGMPEGAVKAELAKLVEESVTFTVFSKCGLPTEPFGYGSFENIQNYNSLLLFMALGNYTVSIARPILREVYQETQNIKNERRKAYEDRAIDGFYLPQRQQRDAVPGNPDFRGGKDRPDASGEVRRAVEGIHDGKTPAPAVRTGGTGENQRDDPAGGRRSGTAEKRIGTGTPGQIPDAGNGGHGGKGGASGDAHETGGGNRDKRSGNAHPVTTQPIQAAQPPTDGFKPSVGVFFVIPPEGEEKLQKEWTVPEQNGEITPEEREESKEPLQTERQGQEATQGDITKEQKAAIQQGEEEIALVDTILCADDIVPEAGEWQMEIAEYFRGDSEAYLKTHTLRLFYWGMDVDYTTKDGRHHFHITGDAEKLTIREEGSESAYLYEELAERIKHLLLDGSYPAVEIRGKEDTEDNGMKGNPSNAIGQGGVEELGQPGSPKLGEGAKSSFPLANNFKSNPTAGAGTGMMQDGQLSLFDLGTPNSYGNTVGTDTDAMLDREAMGKTEIIQEKEPEPAHKSVNDGEIGKQSPDISKPVPISMGNPTITERNLQEGEHHIKETHIGERLQLAQNAGEGSPVPEGLASPPSIGQLGEEKSQPTIPSQAYRQNYHFSADHHLYDGGAKTKCQNNIAAIRLLKKLQSQNRMATEGEQITLAKFVGWGGLANALTPGKVDWESQYQEIKDLLTDEEFQAAQENTLTAYYTEQGIIRHIYNALGQFGFRSGNILDPAMGTGNFFSTLPGSMGDSRLYGVEIEPISGGIAKQLYPEADIQIMGFEKTTHPDQFFDLVVGNIPFNSIRVDDPKYNRYHFRIHDYFLAKSLDKLRPGGILAVITSKYTLDKANPGNRKYLAQRAELIGAIRLPNNAFRQVAGTEVTTDILFLQKRGREIVPDEENSPWLAVGETIDGIPINRYFIDHPEMVLGEMVFDGSMYGNEKATACHPLPGDDLDERLERAVSYLKCEYHEPEQEGEAHTREQTTAQRQSLPADPAVRNFSYTVEDGKLYYREHSRMYLQDITGRKAERIRGLVEITKTLRSLIDFQNEKQGVLNPEEDEAILKSRIADLNRVYDRFVKGYGYLNSKANVAAFSRDANAPLLRSIEKERKGEKGVYDKTAVFQKATIHPKTLPTVVFSAAEALKVSLNVKGKVDPEYMAGLYQKPDGSRATVGEVLAELGDAVYQDPVLYGGNPNAGWQTAGEYLSGHVKEKLAEAMIKAEEEPERFARNVEALKMVQPTPLTAQEISFSLGTPWIPVEVYQEFMYEIFQTQRRNQWGNYATALQYSQYSGSYFIANKGNEKGSITATKVYGTERINAYEILEASLNLRFVEIRDKIEYPDPVTGEKREKYILNKKETILAREKQAQIKAEFERWLFSDPQRGARLVKLYNDRFNNIRPREYDGSDLVLPDLAADITLRKHQLDVVAHGLYGEGNLLMAHEVGAGKTYAAIVLAHEMKRLGKANKPLIAVPNHLVGQWSDAYMELYPSANILVAGERDFERANRRRFVSRIATGDYDCIIMAHSSFELIGLSRERQLAAMREELEAVTQGIEEQKFRDGKDWSLKQMQIFKKNLQSRIDQLFSAERKDDVINFEELGVDALIVDEAHAYKNNFSYTKMRNVAGVSSQSSKRAMDMHQKCQYINEISNGRNVVYLTGTPVSNSMAELYVMQKTLQPQELKQRGLLMFDEWAATFGKVTSSLEIRPEGNGYQMKNRFSQFHNLPELMGMFAMVADIKTADMLNLPTPGLKTGAPQVIKSVCTPDQKRIVMELAERAEAIRGGQVDSSKDNFLKLTHEARLLSIDPRAIEPNLADDPDTKLNLCAKTVAEIYHETEKEHLTQLIFCDQGTPKEDGSFSFYGAMKVALVAQGVDEGEIAFIHDAKTDLQREQLFEKVRDGKTRILMGSTEKMGTGMNVQQKLIALHNLDVPWRPSDLTQRNGRILRQGNQNAEVSIYNYITENTFDAYLWQILEQKQRYISQVMTGRSALRTCDDLDETVLQYAEFKAMAASDPRVKEKMETDNEIGRLMVLKSSWQAQQTELSRKTVAFPEQVARKEKQVAAGEEDLKTYRVNKPKEFCMVVDGRGHTERAKAAEHLMVCARRLGLERGDCLEVGSYAGFSLRLVRKFLDDVEIQLCGREVHRTDYGGSELGNITRIINLAERLAEELEGQKAELENLKKQMETAKAECGKPFPEEERLMELQKKKVQLDLALEFKEGGEDMVEDGAAGQPTQETGDAEKPNMPSTSASYSHPSQLLKDMGTMRMVAGGEGIEQ